MISYIFLAIISGSILVLGKTCDLHASVLVVDPTNCAGYVQCFNGKVRHVLCFNVMLFNAQTRVCDISGTVQCGNRPVNGSNRRIKIMGPTATTLSPKQEMIFARSMLVSDQPCFLPASVHIADPANCAGFVQCFNGEVRHVFCFHGTLFNTQTRYCDFPNSVQCDNRPVNGTNPGVSTMGPTTTPMMPTQSPYQKGVIEHYEFWYSFHCSRFGSSSNIIRWPHPYNCTTYYECKDQKLTPRVCPDSPTHLFYDFGQQNCVIAAMVKCPTAPPYGNTMVPSPEEASYRRTCSQNPNSMMRWPYTRDCRRYFQCTYGSFSQEICPLTPVQLVYNENYLSCVQPKSGDLCILNWTP